MSLGLAPSAQVAATVDGVPTALTVTRFDPSPAAALCATYRWVAVTAVPVGAPLLATVAVPVCAPVDGFLILTTCPARLDTYSEVPAGLNDIPNGLPIPVAKDVTAVPSGSRTSTVPPFWAMYTLPVPGCTARTCGRVALINKLLVGLFGSAGTVLSGVPVVVPGSLSLPRFLAITETVYSVVLVSPVMVVSQVPAVQVTAPMVPSSGDIDTTYDVAPTTSAHCTGSWLS